MQNRNTTPSSTFPYLRPCYISISIFMRASACQPKHQEANNYHSSSATSALVCHSCAQVLFLFRTSRHESIFVKRTTKPITIGHQQRTQEEYIRFNKYMYIYWGPGAINRNRTHNQSSAQVARGVTGVNIVKDVPKETERLGNLSNHGLLRLLLNKHFSLVH